MGDIALLKIPDGHNHDEKKSAHEIIEKEHSIKVVIRIFGRYGEFRKQDSKILIGNRTDTLYTEFGMKFHVDVTESYFSEREKTERQRLKNSVSQNEQILILFAGVGIIPLIITQEKEVNITAVEKNPRAFSLMEENISMNPHRGSIMPVLQDAYRFTSTPYDRVIVPQPYKHHSFDIAAPLVRPGGYLQYYTWASTKADPESFPGFTIHALHPLFSYAPGVWKVCYDLQKLPDY